MTLNSEESTNKLYGATIIKAKEILDFLASQDTNVSLNTITNGVNFTKPTVRKILDTLIYLGWVTESENGFNIGTGMIWYGEKARSQYNILPVITPHLQKLSDLFGETVSFMVPVDNQILLLKKFEGSHSVALKSVIGGRLDMYSTSVGKAILATYSPEKLTHYLNTTTLYAKTPTTITDPQQLMSELDQIKLNGIAFDFEENEIDITCLGTVIEIEKTIFGAFSISVPSYRMTDELKQAVRESILNTKNNILLDLGFHGHTK